MQATRYEKVHENFLKRLYVHVHDTLVHIAKAMKLIGMRNELQKNLGLECGWINQRVKKSVLGLMP